MSKDGRGFSDMFHTKSFLTEHRVGSYGTSDIDTENPMLLAQCHDDKSFEMMKSEGKRSWIKLPESVNGTLIYFLLVELNSRELEVGSYIQSLIMVGAPVFVTFYLQLLLLFTIYASIPDFNADANICGTSPYVQMAVMGIFMIILAPSFASIIKETLAVLRADRVCFKMEEDQENVVLYTLKNSGFKRYLTFFLIVVPETAILALLWFIGSGFILTSEAIGDIIINSVAIAFIMDIDNFCVEAFQTEGVTERASGTLWESPWKLEDTRLADGIPREVEPVLLVTFSNIKKVGGVVIAATAMIMLLRGTYCVL